MSDFDAATLPMTQSQLIEASAGTGKTYTITNLCLRLLLGRGQAPLAINQILILTFTIAATDELKHRIASRIREARKAYKTGKGDDFLLQLQQESADPARDMKLLTAASQLMDEASIFTIHGFCARVLGEHAFESGVLFNQDLNGERDQLLQTAAEDCFRRDILCMRPELRDLALSLWQNPTALAVALKPYLFRGEMTLHPRNIENTDSERIIEGALAAKAAWLEHDLPSILKEAKLNGARTPMKRLTQMTAFCQVDEPDLNDPLWQIYSPQNLSLSVTAKGYLPQHVALDKVSGVSADASRLKAWLWYWLMQRVSDRIQLDKDQWQKLTLDDLLTRTASAVIRPGSTLADTIARRWPVAMIDEFQDTDSIQYSIFQKVYPPTATDKTLMMIGDPKQAIYNFRGADVYTYINARRQVDSINSLSVNWRSSPALIEATNHLFNLEDIFGNDKDMPFHPVSVAPPHAGMGMTINGGACRPYQIYVTGDAESYGTIGPSLESTMDYAAAQTAYLIADDDARLDNMPVNAGQIAFLVRSRRDARAAKAALQSRGIKSVYLTLESVFLQDTAHDLRIILEAIAEPTSDHAIRAALATQLMQCTAEEIESLNHDVQRQQSVLSEFREYHELWLEKSIAPMLNTLLSERQLAEKWLNQPDGERQLTNLRHLIELLQQRAITTPGIFQLIKWFTQEQREAETVDVEERQLRLESDENLVKIVTMHAAKGLEYDIVMIPMPVFTEHTNKGPALFHKTHDGQFVAALELGNNEDHREQSSAEDQAEEMRLLYVALTRARYRCYIGLPKLTSVGQSTIARLLGIDEVGKKDNLQTLLLDLQHSGRLPDTLFHIVDGNNVPDTTFEGDRTRDELVAPPPRPVVYDDWRIHSYTGVVASFAGPHLVTGFADDDSDTETATTPDNSRFTFPRGPRIGVELHSLMEDTDFADTTGHGELCSRTLRRLGLDDEWQPVLTAWLKDIVQSPMGDHALQDIARSDRLDEMEFHFPISASTSLIDYLRASGYLVTTDPGAIRLEGLMTGLIDLVYRCHGKYYIIDYKSNHLGNTGIDYQGDKLTAAMSQHQYHLQYLIYTVAVTRMLKQKLPNYDYNQHFGGVRYLFLRGMNGQNSTGIFNDRPPLNVIDQLDQLLGDTR